MKSKRKPNPKAVPGNSPKMSPKEYEAFVSNLVATLDICKNGVLYRNKKYPGIHQPGDYEIDISVEFNIDGLLFFLLIVECKNWKRPVDRPVIQKLIQTRDAIGAHKAAIASPSGFTKEAADVAKNNGVACWVLARDRHFLVNPALAFPRMEWVFWDLRSNLIEKTRPWLGLPGWGGEEWDDLFQRAIITVEGDRQPKLMMWTNFFTVEDEVFSISSLESGRVFYEWYLGELFNAYIKAALSCPSDNPITDALRQWYQQSLDNLTREGMSPEDARRMLEAVLAGDYSIWKKGQ